MARISKKMFKTLQVICGLSAIAAFGIAPTVSSAATIDVTPTSMGSWAFDNRDASGTIGAEPTASGGMVTGPATPPLGTGSANLAVGNGNNFTGTGGDGTSELRNTGYAGVALSTITSLSYSTFVTANNGQQFPYFGLMIATTGSGSPDDILFFEPPYQQPSTGKPGTPDQGATVLNTWQTWNALTGSWWANSGGGFPTPGCTAGTGACTLADYLALYPLATIENADSGLGGVRFNVGFASPENPFNGYVDNFTLNGTTFNFDPAAATPLPAALPLFATGLGALGLLGWRRKRKGAAIAA
jgi:hypothetical protein